MQDRVGRLMLVIVNRVTARLEEANETTFSNDFQKDIEDLKEYVFIPTFVLVVLCIWTGLWNFLTKP